MITDKHLHSSVGFGCYLVALQLTVFVALGDLPTWVLFFWLSAFLFGLMKEVRDYLSYGKFDPLDWWATCNPLIVIKFYLKL